MECKPIMKSTRIKKDATKKFMDRLGRSIDRLANGYAKATAMIEKQYRKQGYCFGLWLSKNKTPVPMVLLTASGSNYEYEFSGCSAIRVWAGIDKLCVGVMHDGECFDFIADFDCTVSKTLSGNFYCSCCRSDGRARYFKTREKLLLSHSFKPFLAWCNSNLRKDRYLVIRKLGNVSSAHICSKVELKKFQRTPEDNIFIVKPVLTDTPIVSVDLTRILAQ